MSAANGFVRFGETGVQKIDLGAMMIHWFMKRGRKDALLLGVPMMVLVFILLITAGSTQSSEQAENSDGGIDKTYEEVFSAINPADPADVYIQWDMPKSTTTEDQYDSAHSDWFLGAYKSGPGRLFVALDRTILTNDIIYGVHYFSSDDAYLCVDLLDANGDVVVENLYGNLATGSDTDMVLSMDVPLASFSNAAVIQLRYDEGNATVYESRIYVAMDKSRLTAALESCCNSESEHNKSANDFDAVAVSCPDATQTTTSHDNLKEDQQFNPERDNTTITSILKTGIIFVDQLTGDDQFSGRSPVVSGQDGPKRTIRNGLAAADETDTLVIKSGAYNEDLDIRDNKNLEVIIEGNVKL